MLNSYSGVAEALLKSTSDKEAPNFHRYGLLYDLIFDAMSIRQKRELRVCEIGVTDYAPGSFEAFQTLKNVDKIVGIDIKPYPCELSDKAIFYLMDAYKTETIKKLNAAHLNFDIIIDDGSHEPAHQDFFLRHYHNLLTTGGLLICEDVLDIEFYEKQISARGCYGLDLSANVQHRRPDERILLKYKE